MDKWGHMLFSITVSNGFNGEIYLVNSKGGSIANRQVYKSIAEIPGKIDLAVVTIPAAKIMDLIPQIKKKKIKNMLLITSGFSETGPSGRKMEKELAQKAREAGILMIGSNTMGICNPHINLYCTGTPVLPEAGSVAVAAQSGNMGTQLLAFAQDQGIGIRAFCGSGNEAMVTIEDFIESFEKDPLTSSVMLYIESIKNGRRFFESARRVGKKKPIVLLKGGQSQAGNKAAASHTGALASDIHVFDAVCRQAGIIKVELPMELLDLAAAFSSLPLINGKRVAILTMGGGWGVVTADLCSTHGLAVPELSTEIRKRFDKILPPYWSRSNPIDLVGEMNPSIPMTVMEQLCKWDGCDAVINLGVLGRKNFIRRRADMVLKADPTYSPAFLDSVVQATSEFEQKYIKHIVNLMETYRKPVLGVSFVSGNDRVIHCVNDSSFKAVFYQTPERAVKACAKMYEYKRFLARYE
jgi:acyl-CoA synthetase (NDP forming)